MVEDIESGGIGIVLIKDLSRLGRNNAMIAFYTEIFLPDHDVRLIALGDSIDTGHGDNEIMAFKFVINEYYARDISKKIRAVKRNQALKGEFFGAHPPYGYRKDPGNKNKLIVDEEAATVVRRMFKMANNGLGTHQIAKALTDDMVLIPTMYKYHLLGYMSHSVNEDFPYDWHPGTVRRILEGRVYIGDMVSHRQGKKSFKNQKVIMRPESDWITVEGTHEPLVERDLFDRVQKLIKVKKRENTNGITNIFAGILKCLDCGSNMTYRAYTKRNGENGGNFLCNRYRHNSSKIPHRKTCTAHYLPYSGIYNATLSRLNALISAHLTEDEVVRMLTSDHDSHMATQKAYEKLKQRMSELNRIIQKIVEQNALGEINSETFSRLYSGYVNEQSDLTSKIKSYDAKFAAENCDKENAKLFVEQIRKHTVSDELSREKILDLIDKIVIHEPTGESRKANRQQRIEFHYRFVGRLPDSVCSLKISYGCSQ